jgi:hypothetical protein
VAFLGIPQLTGTVFVNNLEEQKPVDWLSAQMLKLKKESSTAIQYDIPDQIRTIKIAGAVQYPNSSISIRQNDRLDRQMIYNTNNDYFAVVLNVVGDTLVITGAQDGRLLPPLTLYVDSNIHELVLNNQRSTNIHINHKLPLDLKIENNSDISLRGNRNTKLKKISISGQSTFSLSHCFTPVIDMQIDNSMVYVDLFNNIDSLKANLVGKSNIKLSNTGYNDDDAKILMEEFNITKYSANIYPTGNLVYYNISKKKPQEGAKVKQR